MTIPRFGMSNIEQPESSRDSRSESARYPPSIHSTTHLRHVSALESLRESRARWRSEEGEGGAARNRAGLPSSLSSLPRLGMNHFLQDIYFEQSGGLSVSFALTNFQVLDSFIDHPSSCVQVSEMILRWFKPRVRDSGHLQRRERQPACKF